MRKGFSSKFHHYSLKPLNYKYKRQVQKLLFMCHKPHIIGQMCKQLFKSQRKCKLQLTIMDEHVAKTH